MVGRLRAPALGLVVALLAGECALAAPERTPAAGLPAMEISVGAGWSVARRSESTVFVVSDDHTCAVAVGVVAVSGEGDASLDQAAAAILGSLGADPVTTPTATPLAGRPGRAYPSVTHPGGGAVRLVLARLDPAHIATLVMLSKDKATPAGRRALEAEAATVKLLTAP
jgi:hypothetical protein